MLAACVTTLGYVPGHLKPKGKATYIPTYGEVKEWAFDMVDGYDSRATMNRYAIYGGPARRGRRRGHRRPRCL